MIDFSRMKVVRKVAIAAGVALAVANGAIALAQNPPLPAPAGAVAPASAAPIRSAVMREFENGIKVGTKITMANWQQYQSFMPDGMVELFKGTNYWKMPSDVEMNIGPTRIFPLPEGYPAT